MNHMRQNTIYYNKLQQTKEVNFRLYLGQGVWLKAGKIGYQLNSEEALITGDVL